MEGKLTELGREWSDSCDGGRELKGEEAVVLQGAALDGSSVAMEVA